MADSQNVDLFALSDLSTPWSLRVVATLRVADHIDSGIDRIGDLAQATDSDPNLLQYVLRHLVSKGVFEQRESGQFALNEPARMLLDGAMRLGLDLDGIGGRMALAWSGLLKQVRSGRPAYDDIFGLPFWEDLDAHPDIAASFDELMGPLGHGAPDPEILVNGDWDSVHTVVDVGGGTGALLTAILKSRPQVHGTLVDFPRTVARAGERFASEGVADRVTFAGQSFFDPLPAGADLYLLNRVLNDWPDSEGLALLQRCAKANTSNSRVVVIGGVSPDEQQAELSIETVLVGGKNRSLAEFSVLVSQAGLAIVATGRQPTGRFIVECRRER